MTRRILLVDDEELIREVVAMSLSLVGQWEVISADSGEEGLKTAAREQPDAILLDVMMPGLDGPATFERLQEDVTTRHIPVILLTAKVGNSDQSRWNELGVSGVLVKPFDPMLLSRQIADLLHWTE